VPAPTLEDLVQDPSRALRVSREQAATLLIALAPVQRALELAALAPRAVDESGPDGPPDRLLDAQQVGGRLGLTVEQVYRRAARWSFTRRPSEGTLRFSERGLERFLAEKSR
jgi:hypothetical protein